MMEEHQIFNVKEAIEITDPASYDPNTLGAVYINLISETKTFRRSVYTYFDLFGDVGGL